MKRSFGLAVLGVGAVVLWAVAVPAAEHGGKEHGGTAAAPAVPAPVSPPPAPIEPTAEQLRSTIHDYVQGIEADEGAFQIEDETTGATRSLTFVRVHERVGKTGDLYYSCTDMRDTQSGELLDLDFDVESSGEGLNVVDVRIHKVNGQARYTYDDQDNRIPLSQARQ